MYKKNELENGNILSLEISPGYACPVVMIREGYINSGELEKDYTLSIWDDIQLNAYCDDRNSKLIEFEFDINHPLYFCFNRFLDADDEFIIDDDLTYDSMKKYVLFKRVNKKIKMIFINNVKEHELYGERFRTFIKNIGPDSRSKIIDFKTKKRIVYFFRDMERVLKEEYHQITFDEFIEILDQSDDMEPVLRLKRR